MAKCLPSGEQSAAIPDGEPLGLNGYVSVTFCSESQYLKRHRNSIQLTYINPQLTLKS